MSEQKIETGTEQLLYTISSEGVGTITLNRPEARNAFSNEMREALVGAIGNALANRDVGVILLTGAGTAFCSGGDVKGMGGRKEQVSDEERLREMKARHRGVTGAMVGSNKPIIAAIPGPAVGAGLALALACDVRIASASAFLSTGYSKIGLSGDYGIAWLLIRTVGEARARELMLTCERVTAERAERLNLVNMVVPDADFRQKAAEFASSIAAGPRLAYRSIKENLNEARAIDYLTAIDHEAERLVPLNKTNDHKEAVKAFVEKRKPVFSDRC
jgi:enoyl-CoA hydratase/carnithine racemase